MIRLSTLLGLLVIGGCGPQASPSPSLSQLCEKTVQAYGPLRDDGPGDAYADLFTADGEFHLGRTVTKGRDALIARHAASNAETIWRHSMTSVQIVEKEDELSGTTGFHIFAGPRGPSVSAPAREIIGDYLDEFTIENGVCKIKSRKVRIIFNKSN